MPSRQLDKYIQSFRDASVWRYTFQSNPRILKPKELTLKGGCVFQFLNIVVAKFVSDNKKTFEREKGREREKMTGNPIPLLSLGSILQQNKL